MIRRPDLLVFLAVLLPATPAVAQLDGRHEVNTYDMLLTGRGVGIYGGQIDGSTLIAGKLASSLAAGGTGSGAAPTGTIRTVTADVTVAPADCGGRIRYNASTAGTITIPTGLPLNCTIGILQIGAGTATATAGSGETVEVYNGANVTAGTGAGMHVIADTASTFQVSPGG